MYVRAKSGRQDRASANVETNSEQKGTSLKPPVINLKANHPPADVGTNPVQMQRTRPTIQRKKTGAHQNSYSPSSQAPIQRLDLGIGDILAKTGAKIKEAGSKVLGAVKREVTAFVDAIIKEAEAREMVKKKLLAKPDMLNKAAIFNSQGRRKKKNKAKDVMNHFRIDWVRNLEYSLIGTRTKETSAFDPVTDKALLVAIMAFQAKHFGEKAIDGKIGAGTRAKLEEVYPILKTEVLGNNLDERTIVPAGASDAQKFQYYRSVVLGTGALFLDTPNRVNVLAIKGVTRENGAIKQTDAAKKAKEALDAGKSTSYFNAVGTKWDGSKNAPDDMIVSLWQDADGNLHVKERFGTTEFASVGNAKYGGATLRDGQYTYMLGQHNTKSSKHAKNVKGTTGAGKKKKNRSADQQAAHDVLNPSRSGKRYNALVPQDKFEVWRSGGNKTLNQADIDKTNREIYKGNNAFIGRQGINFHTGTAKGISSQGCQNLPIDEYVEFIKEFQQNKEAFDKEESNKGKRYTIHYTLVDASKINEGLKLVKTETK